MKKALYLLLMTPFILIASSLTTIKIKNNTSTNMRFEVYNKGNMMVTNGVVNGFSEANVYVSEASNNIYVKYCPAFNYNCPSNASQASNEGYLTYEIN